jgi:hypothetical protein
MANGEMVVMVVVVVVVTMMVICRSCQPALHACRVRGASKGSAQGHVRMS